jgi:DNA gyrase/topoisomerase IV subunit A
VATIKYCIFGLIESFFAKISDILSDYLIQSRNMMKEEDQLENESESFDKEIKHEKDSKKGLSESAMPLKVSDDSNSTEILVFTTHHNVYKVQKAGLFDKFQALEKIKFEEGEKAIYLTGDKGYSGFLIVAFENGKIGKITMSSYRTDYQRKKLINAFNNESKLLFIERFTEDIDLVTISNIKKVVLFNTVQINAVESRGTKGVQVMKEKSGSIMTRVKRASQAKLIDPEYYRKSDTLNVVGYYLKPGDEF